MRTLRSEKGAALVTALMLTMLSLIIAMSLLYVVATANRISASQKRYRTALAAAHGAVDLFSREIIPQLFNAGESATPLETKYSLVNLQLPGYDCLRQKLSEPTANWSEACRARATADPAVSPDATFVLSSERVSDPGFTVATKIVDSVPGNSDKSGIDYLDAGSGVSGRDEVIHPQHVPGIYSIAVEGAKEGGVAGEKARLSVLYAY